MGKDAVPGDANPFPPGSPPRVREAWDKIGRGDGL